MARGYRSARFLDDPVRPLFGLTIAQDIAFLVGALAAYPVWHVLGIFSALGYFGLELQIFLTGACVAAVIGVGLLLAGDRTEPFGAQIHAYVRRRHRYGPRLLQSERGGRHGSRR
jgi:hypothetical protein